MSIKTSATTKVRIGGQDWEAIWASCSIEEFGDTGTERHLVAREPLNGTLALTTACGYSASGPGIWRADRRKRKCARCKAAER